MDIHDAVERGRTASVKKYLAEGGAVDAVGTRKRTLLHAAAAYGRTKVAELLLEAGAAIEARDYQKRTALHLAANIGADAIVAALLERGAKAKDTYGELPLHALCSGGGKAKGPARVAIVEQLLDAGAPVDAKGNVGRTPLWYAAATGTLNPPAAITKARLAVVKALLAAGAKPNKKADGQMGTPLDAAKGLHQQKKYRIVWDAAVALLEAEG